MQIDGPSSLKQSQSSPSDKLKFVEQKEFQPPQFLRGIEKSMIRKISDRAKPGIIAYPMIARMVGGRAVTYQLPAKDDFSFDVDDFKQRISPRTKVVICISPSNPTGRALSKDDLCAMADAVKSSSSDAFIVSDEIYRELYYTPERPASISEFYPRTIVVSGLSQSMRMTGWRIRWLAGQEAVITAALVLHGYCVTCVWCISQKAALAAWTDEAAVSREEMRAIFLKRRDHLLDVLRNELGLR